MSIIAHIALLAWAPAIVVMFAVMAPRRAAIWAYIIGWMFMPVVGYALSGLPDYTRGVATGVGILGGMLIFDTVRLFSLRLKMIDLPMVLWCIAPFTASISNSLGFYDGLSAAIDQTFLWGVPYFIGRLYIRDTEGLKELAISIALAAAIYVPLCLFESRMSPQLYTMFYGWKPASLGGFHTTYRLGGWRPIVFLENGLTLSIWMSCAALVTWGVAYGRSHKKVWLGVDVSTVVLAWVLLFIAVWCRSLGAIALMLMALGLYWATVTSRSKIYMYSVILAFPAYLILRVIIGWQGQEVIDKAYEVFNHRQAFSLETRISNENALTDRAWERPIFGWGGWGRMRVQDDSGRNTSLVDSMWIIALGQYGLLGLVSFTLVLIMPQYRFLRAIRMKDLKSPEVKVALGMALAMIVYSMDKLMNGYPNPVFMLMSAGLLSCSFKPTSEKVKQLVKSRLRRQAALPRHSRRALPMPGR